MKTIREVYNILPFKNIVMKDGKALFKIKDVMAAAKKEGIANPERLLKKEAKSGAIKIVNKKLIDFEPQAHFIVRKLKTKEGKGFKANVVQEGDTPNIYIKKPDKGGELYAKIWIRPNGKIEIRRFLKDKDIGIFIDRKGKVTTQEYEEALVDSEREHIED